MRGLNIPKERTFVGPALIWKRIAAFFIDLIIINFVILLPFRSLFERMLPKDYSFSQAYSFFSSGTQIRYISYISFAVCFLVILYFYMMEAKMHQTIGKMLMRIYVESDNSPLKSWQIFVRSIVFIPIFPFILLWILDPLFMVFTKTNQRLSEILSKTKVVERYAYGE